MAYADATKAQKEALRGALVNAVKPVEIDISGGQNLAASTIEAGLSAVTAALDGAGVAVTKPNQLTYTSGETVQQQVIFQKAFTSGQSGSFSMTPTIEDGKLVGWVIS